jgi:hypothetical protein
VGCVGLRSSSLAPAPASCAGRLPAKLRRPPAELSRHLRPGPPSASRGDPSSRAAPHLGAPLPVLHYHRRHAPGTPPRPRWPLTATFPRALPGAGLARGRVKQVKLPFCSFAPAEAIRRQSCFVLAFGTASWKTTAEAAAEAVPEAPILHRAHPLLTCSCFDLWGHRWRGKEEEGVKNWEAL